MKFIKYQVGGKFIFQQLVANVVDFQQNNAFMFKNIYISTMKKVHIWTVNRKFHQFSEKFQHNYSGFLRSGKTWKSQGISKFLKGQGKVREFQNYSKVRKFLEMLKN